MPQAMKSVTRWKVTKDNRRRHGRPVNPWPVSYGKNHSSESDIIIVRDGGRFNADIRSIPVTSWNCRLSLHGIAVLHEIVGRHFMELLYFMELSAVLLFAVKCEKIFYYDKKTRADLQVQARRQARISLRHMKTGRQRIPELDHSAKQTTEKQKAPLWVLILLHGGLLISSLSGVCSKKAALLAPFSRSFLFWYGLVLVSMFVYAVLWQQVLKRMDLTTAYANKPVGLIWGMVWGVLLFQETITIRMILGAAVIFAGIYLVVTSDNSEPSRSGLAEEKKGENVSSL